MLGGIISPIDGIGPADLEIDSLVKRVASGEVKEVMFALSTTMEGDTTNFFIYRKLSLLPCSDGWLLEDWCMLALSPESHGFLDAEQGFVGDDGHDALGPLEDFQ